MCPLECSPQVKQYLAKRNYFADMDEYHGMLAETTVGSTASGKLIHLQIVVNAQRLIVKARCKVHGCGYTMAAASYLCEIITLKDISEAYNMNSKMIATALGLPSARIYAAVLAEDAIKTAINTFLRGDDHDH